MTEPLHPPIGDPTSVILARMEVKLDNALAEQSRHGSVIERHDRILGEHGNRITVLETQQEAEGAHALARLSNKQVFWGAVVALASVAAVVITLIVSFHARGG